MPSVFDMLNQQTIRGPVNPLDKATIVSIYNQQIIEQKHTIQPGTFVIEAGTFEKPSFLTVGPSSWWKQTDPKQPLLEIPIGSLSIAESVVRDYCNGMFGVNMGDRMPGLFYVPGEVDYKKLMADPDMKAQLFKAKKNQENWYTLLIKFADSFWSVSKGNPLVIMDDMRHAAIAMGKTDREWVKDVANIEHVRCVYCGAFRDVRFPKCGHCLEIVDKDLARRVGLLPAEGK